MTTDYLISVGLIFALALGLSLVLTRLAMRLSQRFGLLARPDARRKHTGLVAKFGALPLWGAFTAAALAAQLMPVLRADAQEITRLTGLLLGGTAIFVAGVIDDRFDLPARIQLVGQFLAALIAVLSLVFIERFNNPLTGETVVLESHPLILVISIFWLMLMMNTVNFLDGVDGLAGGVNLIAAALLFVHTVRENQLSVSLLPLALMGTLLGFLVFNWHPSRIHMGSGAVYLGFTIGALSIIGGAKMATILLVMGLPLLDLAWQAARRITAGKHPFKGDRGHLHFRLIDAGVSPRVIVLGYYAFCTAFGLLALMTTSRQFKLIGLVVLIVLVFAGFALVVRRQQGRVTQVSAQEEPKG